MPDTQNKPVHTNRLARETSPYLLQHAHNTVNWYPWGPEAFAAARESGKPIFLSVGYSTCYWCHVMERQCFENEQIAAVMNEKFISIKVDREERPDVDQLYMTAVQILTRHGGWPMSVFLTPDLRPFYGGTYFPPTDAHGRPGFVTVMRGIDDAWHNRRKDVNQSADQLVDLLQQLADPISPQSPVKIDDDFIDRIVHRSIDDYDPAHGGFGDAPKFPRQTLLELLLAYTTTMTGNTDLLDAANALRDRAILKKVCHTLSAMADGGIRDQLGGGFHRYSTDAQWLIPHFEIMLYDNALLAWIYTETYRQTEDRRYAAVARGILDFILREMTSPDGAFYTAFDAEVDAREGKSYLWTPDEVQAVLGEQDARLFNHVYGLDKGFNFADPHHDGGDATHNVLYRPAPLEELAGEMSLSVEELEAKLEPMRLKLYGARRARKQPLLDTKVLTEWNALAIRAFAYAGGMLGEQRYLDVAARAMKHLLRHHRTAEGLVLRTARPDKGSAQPLPGFLDDYAAMLQALLTLQDTQGDEAWGEEARGIATLMRAQFGGQSGGFYFTPRDAHELIVRQKVGGDSPLPSGNALAALAMIEMGEQQRAYAILSAFAEPLRQQPESMSAMAQAALGYVRRYGAFTVQPPTSDDRAPAPARPPSPEQVAIDAVSLAATWVTEDQVDLRLRIAHPYHITAKDDGDNLIGIHVTVPEPAAAMLDHIDYPPAAERSFPFSDQPVRVYDGEIAIALHFKPGHRLKSDPLEVVIQYQACGDAACLLPVKRRLSVGRA